MTALYIIAGILAFLILLLVIQVSVDINYRDKLLVSVRYAGIKVFDGSKPKKEKPAKESKKQEKPAADKPKKKNFVSEIFRKNGKIEGVKFIFGVLKITLSRIIWMLKKIKFRNLYLDISVASDDAANTAVTYGAVCAAVYPVINLLEQNTGFFAKEINIYTDFEKLSPEIKAAISLKTRLIYALITLIFWLTAFLKLKKESGKNGRK